MKTGKPSPIQQKDIELLPGVWMTCEYISGVNAITIVSLGDADAQRTLTGRGRHMSLDSAAKDFFFKLPPDRKLVVLVPKEDLPSEQWPWRQLLKKEITALETV